MNPSVPDHPLIVFRHSPIHGWGGFARTWIRRNRRIIEYRGRPLSPAKGQEELDRGNCFIFTVDDHLDLDGGVDWNPARYLNHGCSPNCEARIVGKRVWIHSLRHIRTGEELTYNYGHDLEAWEERPCACGSPECVGYRVAAEHFGTVRKAT